MKIFKLFIDVKNNDGTGYKQAATVTLDDAGQVIAAIPMIAKYAAEQLFSGKVNGQFKTEYSDVVFIVEPDGDADLTQEISALYSRCADLEIALGKISAWDDLPPEFVINYGSNGERDYYRNMAKDMLNKQWPSSEDLNCTVPVRPVENCMFGNVFDGAFNDIFGCANAVEGEVNVSKKLEINASVKFNGVTGETVEKHGFEKSIKLVKLGVGHYGFEDAKDGK